MQHTNAEKNFHAAVPAALLVRVQNAAAQAAISLDELATQALQLHIARASLQRFQQEGEARRGRMDDSEVETRVSDAVQQYRREGSGRG